MGLGGRARHDEAMDGQALRHWGKQTDCDNTAGYHHQREIAV